VSADTSRAAGGLGQAPAPAGGRRKPRASPRHRPEPAPPQAAVRSTERPAAATRRRDGVPRRSRGRRPSAATDPADPAAAGAQRPAGPRDSVARAGREAGVHILVVDDEPRVADLLRRALAEEGHHVDVAGTLAEARAALEGHGAEVLVVDRMLPDGDGLSLIQALRARGDGRPALVLSARDRVDERVAGLHGGADDYLGKPFALEELLARVEALGRRSVGAERRLVVGDLVLDVDAARVWRAGVELRLTALEFRLLRHLMERAGRVVSKTRLLEAVWDLHHDPGTNLVEVYISYLRAKVDRGHGAPLIHTVRGMGYCVEARG